jgi:hypothetical protein
VRKLIQIAAQPASAIKDQDSSATFSVQVSGTGTFVYQWFHNDNIIHNGGSGSALFIKPLTLADSGTYTCVIKDQWGDSIVTTAAVLTVIPKSAKVNTRPVISVTGHPNILFTERCSLTVSATDPDSGQALTFKVTSVLSGYNFSGNLFTWMPAAGYLSTDTLKIDTAVFIVTDNGYPALSDTQKVTITVSLKILPPDSVKGVVAVSRINGNFIFKWNKANNADQYLIYRSKDTTGFVACGSVTDTSFTNTINDTAFYYYVVATNSKGSSSPSQRIRSNVVNDAPKWSHDTVSVDINEGALISLNCIDSCKDTNGDAVSFSLLPGGPATDSLIGMVWRYTPSFTDAGSYTVKIKAWDGTDSSFLTIKLHVLNVPRPPQPQPQSLSTKRNTALQITLSAISPDSTAITTWTIDTATTHGSAVQASSAQPTVTYTPTSGFIGTDYFTFKASIGSLTSTYSAKVTIKVDTSNIAPQISQKLTAKTIVKGDSLSLTVSVNSDAFPSPLYSWFKAGAFLDSSRTNSWKKANAQAVDSGYYYVIVSNEAGRDSSGAHMTVNVGPVITTQPVSQTIISGSPVNFPVAAAGLPAPTYQWKRNGVPCTGASATTTSFSIAATAMTDTGAYTVDVMNIVDTVTSNPVRLTIIVPPKITTQSGNQTVKAGTSATFTVVASGVPDPSYQWKRNGVNCTSASATTATLSVNPATIRDTGTYTVYISNTAGSVTSSGATLAVTSTPVITVSSPTISNDSSFVNEASPVVSGTSSSEAGVQLLTAQIDGNGVAVTGMTNWSFSLAGATKKAWHSISVTMTDSASKTVSKTFQVFVRPTLAKPATPTLVTSTSRAIAITWPVVSNCDRYLIYRSDNGISGAYQLIKDTSSIAIKDTLLKVNKEYWFKIRGYYGLTGGKFSRDTTQFSDPVNFSTKNWFQKVYGFAGQAASVLQWPDSGFVFCTYQGAGGEIIKTNASGDSLWRQPSICMGLRDMRRTADNGLVVVGTSDLTITGGFSAFIAKTDSLGKIAWSKSFGGSKKNLFTSVRELPYASSQTKYVAGGGASVQPWSLAAGVGANGDSSFFKRFDSSFSSGAMDLNANSYAIAVSNGSQLRFAECMVDPWGTLFEKSYGLSGLPKSLRLTSDNGYLILIDSIILKVSSVGDSQWTKKLGSITCFGDDSFQKLSNGKYAIVGNTAPYEPCDIRFFVINQDGTIVIDKTYPNGFASAVQQTLDGGYIIAGASGGQALLIKTDTNGDTGE